jgi:hypothetical protein
VGLPAVVTVVAVVAVVAAVVAAVLRLQRAPRQPGSTRNRCRSRIRCRIRRSPDRPCRRPCLSERNRYRQGRMMGFAVRSRPRPRRHAGRRRRSRRSSGSRCRRGHCRQKTWCRLHPAPRWPAARGPRVWRGGSRRYRIKWVPPAEEDVSMSGGLCPNAGVSR